MSEIAHGPPGYGRANTTRLPATAEMIEAMGGVVVTPFWSGGWWAWRDEDYEDDGVHGDTVRLAIANLYRTRGIPK